MKYTKVPLNNNEIIEVLKERGLSFSDEDRALRYLNNVGYFRLKGYMFHLQSKDEDHVFVEKNDFNDIINLYQFDKKFRAVIMEYLERIEISLRAKLNNKYCLKYGYFWYNDISLYKDAITYASINKEIEEAINNPKEMFIKSFKDKYTEELIPPSNMALEILTFGKLSKLYKGLENNKLKVEIANEYNLSSNILTSWFIYLTIIRNICAHHSRLWNKKISANQFIIPENKKYKFKGIVNESDFNKTMYGVISIIYRLLKSFNPSNNFILKIEKLIEEHNINVNLMGFPENWKLNATWYNE